MAHPDVVHDPSPQTFLHNLVDLGTLVARSRKDLGLTLDEASARLGVSRRLLFELEHGKRAVGADTVIRILNMFGFDVVARRRGAPYSA